MCQCFWSYGYGERSTVVEMAHVTPFTIRKIPMIGIILMAEGRGFEPPIPCGMLAFQASALDHYATPPWESVGIIAEGRGFRKRLHQRSKNGPRDDKLNQAIGKSHGRRLDVFLLEKDLLQNGWD